MAQKNKSYQKELTITLLLFSKIFSELKLLVVVVGLVGALKQKLTVLTSLQSSLMQILIQGWLENLPFSELTRGPKHEPRTHTSCKPSD